MEKPKDSDRCGGGKEPRDELGRDQRHRAGNHNSNQACQEGVFNGRRASLAGDVEPLRPWGAVHKEDVRQSKPACLNITNTRVSRVRWTDFDKAAWPMSESGTFS